MLVEHELPTTSLAAVWSGTNDLRLEDRPLPRLGTTDVAVDLVGCCGGATRPADTVAIVGAGALGLLVLQVARLKGATHIVVSDLDPSRRELATRFGADRVVDAASENLLDVAREMTEGRGVDCAFEAVG